MIISIWRYSHLALAISSSVFVLVLAVTGAILAFDPISTKLQGSTSVADFPERTLAQTIQVLQEKYDNILSISTDANGFVSVSIITDEGDLTDFYIHPITGERTGEIIEQSDFIKSVTNFHRSLFLKSWGRFFVGLNSLLLLLIAITGLALLIKRQQGVKQLFNKIIKENFNQYTHVYLGRLVLIPLIIITVTGVYLSLLRFDVIPSPTLSHEVDFESITDSPRAPVADFHIFTNTLLSEVRTIDFPFSDDPIDYYQLSLKHKEVLLNQYTGEILSELSYPVVVLLSGWSTTLHTGQGSILWSLILALSSIAVPFFMYTGFKMTIQRRSSKIKNSFHSDECNYIILVGSETGTTIQFATLFHSELKKLGIKSYLAQLNDFTHYPSMEQLIVFTATYGQGEAPANATKFKQLFQQSSLAKPFSYSVVGFGSLAYPDFCQYALELDQLLATKAQRLLAPHTINNRSWEAFKQWGKEWGDHLGLTVPISKDESLIQKDQRNLALEVVSKNNYGDTFTLEFKSNTKKKIVSGDLLAIYPEEDTHERLYSIGSLSESHLLISVKLHDKGVCSNYLNQLAIGDSLQAGLVENKHFQFPIKAKEVIMIANGTGIAPFIGMLAKNKLKAETTLYWGGKSKADFDLYKKWIDGSLNNTQLSTFKPAYSREADHEKTYVQDLVTRDANLIAQALCNNGIIMICGSIAMQKGVIEVLNQISLKQTNKSLSYFENNGQIKMDCY